jgi:16S rRNA (uracil1498-N3)-methyltransferase
MRRLFLPPERIEGEEVELTTEEAHYLLAVLRLTAGTPVTVFDGRGHERSGELVEAPTGREGGPRAPRLRFSGGVTLVEMAKESRPLWLIQGLPKNDRSDLILQKATELGAARVSWVAASRSIQRGGPSESRRMERWYRIAQEASRQCGGTRLPAIDPPRPLALVLDLAAAKVSGEGHLGAAQRVQGAILWEEERQVRLRHLLPDVGHRTDTAGQEPWALAIGPEGGWTAEEVALAAARGLGIAGLGPRILRTETAAIACLAIAAYHLGALG